MRHIRLEQGRVVENPYGAYWTWSSPVELATSGHFLSYDTRKTDRAVREHLAQREDLQLLARFFPQDTVFLDIETCGLAGSMVFLVGLICGTSAGPVIRLHLARDYSEEPAILYQLWQELRLARLLVTFNGKSFDWPMVRDRSVLHFWNCRAADRRRAQQGQQDVESFDVLPCAHVDLLHLSRRMWRGQLPDCRLRTIERYMCGRWRVGDVDGSQIPAIYHEFVRREEAAGIEAVLLHNALDLLTCFELAALFSRSCPSVSGG
jgi:hypothetical protein